MNIPLRTGYWRAPLWTPSNIRSRSSISCGQAHTPTTRPFLVSISVANLDETVNWYRDNLGFSMVPEIVPDCRRPLERIVKSVRLSAAEKRYQLHDKDHNH